MRQQVFSLLIVIWGVSRALVHQFIPKPNYLGLSRSPLFNDVQSCSDCVPPNDSPAFIVDVSTDPNDRELSNKNIVKIVLLEASDMQCNQLGWKCLGYRFDPVSQQYNNDKVFPKWKEKYPSPPDLIGFTRNYEQEVDRPVREAIANLFRSIPRDYKGGVKSLSSEGFKGYKLNNLTPNKTRRAQVIIVYSIYFTLSSIV
jgi:hypothetical protein